MARNHGNSGLAALAALCFIAGSAVAAEPSGPMASRPADVAGDLWRLAQRHAGTLRFSTLFTAQDVKKSLSSPEGREQAMQWCRAIGVTHVYLESFRNGYTAPKELLLEAKRAFGEAGFLVSGCVTTTEIGRKSVRGWMFPCFTEAAGLEKLRQVFSYTAGLFDEIMIDDFFATKCECDECIRARQGREWGEFRCDLLADVSRRYVLEPARQANPKVKIILKYPQWYEEFHQRGYEVVRQTEMFDTIWVGTETRDPDNQQWGRKTQYEAYFIMRWLGEIGGAKCGGGWFDPYGTSPATYVEQARQTVLGGAREALLFCYGSLRHQNGPANVETLRRELPQLFKLAELIRGREIRGIAAPKPPGSDADGNAFIYDFVGMLGLPLVPTAEVHADVPAAFLPIQALKDSKLAEKVEKMTTAGTPLLVTRQLADRLKPGELGTGNAEVLDVPKDAWALMDLSQERVRQIRRRMLTPLGVEFEAPTRVALYLFGDDLAVVENFNDRPVEVRLALREASRPTVVLALPDTPASPPSPEDRQKTLIPARALVALRFGR